MFLVPTRNNQESWFFWKSWFEPGILVEVVESWFNQENQESWFFWKSWFEPGILVEVVESWFNQENQESWLILVQPGITRNPGFFSKSWFQPKCFFFQLFLPQVGAFELGQNFQNTEKLGHSSWGKFSKVGASYLEFLQAKIHRAFLRRCSLNNL